MSIEKRRFIRFSLDIPVYRRREDGEVVQTFIRQVSVNGCLMECDGNVLVADLFRIELELPNRNRLPLWCEVLYKFPGRRIGAKFINVSQFEQELLGQIISQTLEEDGLSLQVDPFAVPPTYVAPIESEKIKVEM